MEPGMDSELARYCAGPLANLAKLGKHNQLARSASVHFQTGRAA